MFDAARFTLLALVLVLAGCGTPRHLAPVSPPPPAPPEVTFAGPLFGRAFGDSKPHDWDGPAPSRYPVHGIDVSRWQGEIDWQAAAASGVAFAYIKATEGGDVADPAFTRNWRDAARAGIPRGAYHYYHFCRTAAENARWFIRNVPVDATALPPVLDMEWTPRSRTCRFRPPPEDVRAEAIRFLTALERHYGRRPVIYTTVDFWRDTGIGQLHDYEFWLRSVAGHPSIVYPDAHWTFWQYTGTGIVPGISGNTDINVFRGATGDWALWLARRRP